MFGCKLLVCKVRAWVLILSISLLCIQFMWGYVFNCIKHFCTWLIITLFPWCSCCVKHVLDHQYSSDWTASSPICVFSQNGLQERSEVITTYALCGFSNIASIGIQIGSLTPMAPSKAKDLASVAVRALLAAMTVCFMKAAIAGMRLTHHYFLLKSLISKDAKIQFSSKLSKWHP